MTLLTRIPTQVLVTSAVILFLLSFWAAHCDQNNPTWVFAFNSALFLLMAIPSDRRGNLPRVF